MHRRIAIALLAITLWVSASISSAQDAGNLLRDPGFEGQYTSRGRSDFNIPADWNSWVATSPRTESWMNLDPVAFPHNGPGPNPQSGARAVNMNRGFATFTAAIFQQVTVPPNSNVVGSGWAQIKTCNVAPNADNCGSAVESGAFTRVGIDPTGGTDPNSPSIIWSNNAQPHDRWEQMTVNATAAGGTVTFFMYVTQRWPSQLNNVYFDSASLTVGGGGAPLPSGATGAPAAPPPTPVPANVPFVVAQGERPDGSVVHRVQPGDTVDSIAVAYGVTRQQILELNNLRDARIIQIGQELTIRPARSTSSRAEQEPAASAEASPAPTEAASAAAETEPTEVAQVPTESEEDPEPTAQPAPTLDLASLPPAPVRSASAGDVLPAADPALQSGQICVLMFDDINQNRIQESGEPVLAGGDIALVQSGAVAAQHTTDGSEPFCLTDLTSGDYVASIVPPEGYGLTTPDQLRLRVAPGAAVALSVGAAQGAQPPAIPPPDIEAGVQEPALTESEQAANPLTENLGLFALGGAAVALVLGAGLTFALRRR